MDSETFMSATANVAVGEEVVGGEYWSGFAGLEGTDEARRAVATVMASPDVSVKSTLVPGTELRMGVRNRIGLAGIVHYGEVELAFPFFRDGARVEMAVDEVITDSQGRERWISGRARGLRLTFFDVLASVARSPLEIGETYVFVLNALALSLRRVQPLPFLPSDPDEELMLGTLRSEGHLIPKRSDDRGQAIFQSSIGSCSTVPYGDRDFRRVTVGFGETKNNRLHLDLFIAAPVAQTVGLPLPSGEELAGVLWLQGYRPDDLLP